MVKQLRIPATPKALAVILVAVAVLAVSVFVLVDRAGADNWLAECTGMPAEGDSPDEVVDQARKALLDAGGDPRLGIEVLDLDACRRTVSWRADTALPTASIVKLLIALDLLDRSGVPEDEEADAVRRMLSASDDRVASRLWGQLGGPALVQRQAKALQLRGTRPPADAGQWGDTLMSPADIATVYRHITSSLEPAERVFLTEALESAPVTAADGFEQHFGIPAALPEANWAIKQGWGSSQGRRVLNTTGLVRTTHTYVVTLLSTWRLDADLPSATAALTKATQALRSALT